MIPDIHQLQEDLDNNSRLFLDILDTIPADKLQQKNARTEWSIMECAEHLLITEQQVAKTLQHPSRPVEGREPDSKIAQIDKSFLEFDKRLLYVPDPDTMEGAFKDVAGFSQAFRHNRNLIKAALAQAPLDEECRGAEHPLFGHMTRLEWAHYVISHTERHLQQINRIEASLAD
ncbi:DinB family protein [Chitinophaga agrisoli]|uniref:DinB family protein n=1 Tax=Chitinophaga agrisoli TaxID=2607653 RepID=A0A5B2VMB0_9BACT|nr:DinB family protein [Chitinophaga agrisoli]KAA2240161.1 DinB family protein [Chitinophaga agrisoli]